MGNCLRIHWRRCITRTVSKVCFPIALCSADNNFVKSMLWFDNLEIALRSMPCWHKQWVCKTFNGNRSCLYVYINFQWSSVENLYNSLFLYKNRTTFIYDFYMYHFFIISFTPLLVLAKCFLKLKPQRVNYF